MNTWSRMPWGLMALAVAAAVPCGPRAARAESAGGAITGTVVFEGTPPTPAKVNFGAEKACAIPHGDNPPDVETLVVNPNGTVRWTLVYLKETPPGAYAPPAEPVVYEQQGCVFAPHVGAVMAGQPIDVLNDDPVLHNVRAQSTQGQSFNIAQPMQGMKTRRTLQKPELGIPLKCDVHFWMKAYLHVLPHPFFAVTGEEGRFSLSGVPPGTYTLEAWHESLGTATQTVTVADGQSQTVVFTLRTP